jgi:hypothetical protein
MDNIVKQAIDESWREFQSENNTTSDNGCNAHEHGWKEGAEWMLSELVINKKISKEDLKKYMNKIQ